MTPGAQILLIFLCLAVSSTTGENKAFDNGTIQWSANEEDGFKSSLKTTFDDEGLGPWYSLANSFIGTVLNKDPWALAGKLVNKGFGSVDIQNDLLTGYFLGIIITVGFGMLFCLLMPIVGFCFCCCRCCGNCGGEMTQKDSSRNGCKRAVFGIILSLITLLMFAGVLLTFVCNDNMSKTLDKAKKTSSGIVEETSNFINKTIGEFDNILNKDLTFVLDKLLDDISDKQLKKLVGEPFVRLVEKSIEKPIEAVSELANNSKKMENQLDIITNNTEFLQSKTSELENRLNLIKANFSKMSEDCKNVSLDNPCDAVDDEQIGAGANFSNLPDVSNELNNIKDVTSKDFVGSAQKGLDTFRDLPDTMISKTNDTRAEITKMISNATEQGNTILDDVRNSSNKVVLDPLKDVEKQIHDLVDSGKEYDKYRWYAGVGLTCLLLLIVVLMALGLMCGICGHDKHATPSSRGTVSNMGGNCLMAATGFSFIFASFLMLLTTICFIIGAPTQGIVCEHIQSGDVFSQFLDSKKYFDPLPLNNILKTNKTDIKIGESLDNCRKNQPAYPALHLDSIFNISEKLDIKELLGDKVDEQFKNLEVNLTDQELLNNDTTKSLEDLSNSGVEKINFTQFTDETSKGVTTNNLTELADQMDQFAENMTQAKAQEIAQRAKDTAASLRSLETEVVQPMQDKSKELEKNVEDLKAIGSDLKNMSINARNAAEQAEKDLHNSSKELNDVITKYKDRVLGWGFQFTDHILHLVNTELGRCKPLTNVFDAVIVLVCKDFLQPFNGFWLGIGFCLFFFIPAIIFSVKLAKHYRRMSYESDFDDQYNGGPDMMEMGQPVGQEKKLWANPKGYANGTRQ